MGPMDRELLIGEGLRVTHGDSLALAVERVALREGELLGILGPNGAGKSTLLRTLAMLEPRAEGTIRYRGLSGGAAERALRRSSAAVFQRPHFWHDTVAYNVGLGLRLRRKSTADIRARTEKIAHLMGIGHLLTEDVKTLSGGEAQRVALARALVLEPDILFLDEPTASLDTAARYELREDLERMARERAGAVLLITHDRHEAFALADRIAVLKEGRMVQVGTPAELYENPEDEYIARITGAELTLRGAVVEVGSGTLLVDIGPMRLRVLGTASRGTRVKVAYRPEDLVLAPAEETARRLSTRNVLYATVTGVRTLGGLVRVGLNGPPELAATVTRSAADELELEPGRRVSVRIKATALHAFPV